MTKLLKFGVFALMLTGCQSAAPVDCVCDGDPGMHSGAEADSVSDAEKAVPEPVLAGGEEIALPAPVPVSVSLTAALERRRTVRSFSGRMPDVQNVSNLLWAADGINRSDGKRTAPSSYNKQSVTLFLAFEQGTYRYDFKAHKLIRTSQTDIRTVPGAPFEMIFVSNHMSRSNTPGDLDYAATTRGIDAGVVSQNAALYCAASGLGTGIRMILSRDEKTVSVLGLGDSDTLMFLMPVGYEKK